MKSHRGEILSTLQSMGVMQIEEGFDAEGLTCPDTHDTALQYQRYASTLDEAITVLSHHTPDDARGLSLFDSRRQVSRRQFDVGPKARKAALGVARKIVDIERGITEDREAIGRIEDTRASLGPWAALDVPLDFRGTREAGFAVGSLQGELDAADLVQELSAGIDVPDGSADAPLEATVLGYEDGQTFLAILYHRSIGETLWQNLRRLGFARPPASLKGLPRERLAQCNRDVDARNRHITESYRKIESFSPRRPELEVCADYFRARSARYELLTTVPESQNVFFLEGWVTAREAGPLKSLLEGRWGAYVEFEEPREGELEPTLLHNNAFSSSAEPVLESYGLPRHGKVDPTFVMSIFYVFFFGMMLSDAGYGILMSILCAVVLAKARERSLTKEKTRMFQLFFWCGLSTTFWGLMFGGFFGDAIDTIATTFFGYSGPKIVQPLWFEPMSDPMTLLVWCLLFGIVHLYAGLAIKGYELLREKDVVGFVGDVADWYLFLTGLVLMLLPTDLFTSISGMTIVLPGWVGMVSRACAAVGAVLILALGGRGSSNWAVRIALGAYDLYGVTSWLSDLLSYSRLLALGLATGVIASVVNMMAAMVAATPLGVVGFAVVFLLGHTLNIGINVLGAYVHTNRLQYVEFFGKFYEAGGRAFRPFGTSNKYVEIREES